MAFAKNTFAWLCTCLVKRKERKNFAFFDWKNDENRLSLDSNLGLLMSQSTVHTTTPCQLCSCCCYNWINNYFAIRNYEYANYAGVHSLLHYSMQDYFAGTTPMFFQVFWWKMLAKVPIFAIVPLGCHSHSFCMASGIHSAVFDAGILTS